VFGFCCLLLKNINLCYDRKLRYGKSTQSLLKSFFFFKAFIYLFDRGGERESTSWVSWRRREAEGEAGSPISREPDAGLDPRTLRL